MRNYSKKITTLYIDTTDNQKTRVRVIGADTQDEIFQETSVWTSQVLLTMIDKLLSRNNFSVANIQEIRVNCGPGSYTGIRVGISVANILGKLLGIRVNGKRQIVLPKYV